MIRKRSLLVFIFFLGLFVLASFSCVKAKEILKQEVTETQRDGLPVGKITLYDDYSIEYEYGIHKLQGVKIKVCKESLCDITEYQITPDQSFMDGQEAKYNISNYLAQEDEKVTYKIFAEGYFKPNDSGSWFGLELEYTVQVKGSEETSENMTKEDFDESTNKVKKVFNTYIIPGIYIILGLAIIIKGILLSIDIVKHSDDPAIRQEKLKGTVYLFLALLLVALINTGVGIITGLFK